VNAEEPDRTWRVGELAAKTGLTVRALHHYHAIGLLVPSTHHDGAHRRYTEADVRRLHHILALRGFGFSLAEIGQLLDGARTDPRELFQRQLDQVNERIVRAYRLRHSLLGVLGALDHSVEPSAPELVELIEVMTAMEGPLTPEQFAEMSENRRKATEQLSTDQLAEMAQRRQHMADQLSPDELAEMQRRRAALVPPA
jgi:MerR family transcriptional regulator, thiopeptide resistance regulator